MKLIVLLSCGHRLDADPRNASLGFYREARDDHWDLNCHEGGGGAHASHVTTILTSTVDRIWIEEL